MRGTGVALLVTQVALVLLWSFSGHLFQILSTDIFMSMACGTLLSTSTASNITSIRQLHPPMQHPKNLTSSLLFPMQSMALSSQWWPRKPPCGEKGCHSTALIALGATLDLPMGEVSYVLGLSSRCTDVGEGVGGAPRAWSG